MKNSQIDKVRDALLRGEPVAAQQVIKARTFIILIKMERIGDPDKVSVADRKAAEEMAAYIVEGGMAL